MVSRVGLYDFKERKSLILARAVTLDGPANSLDAIPTEPSLFLRRQ